MSKLLSIEYHLSSLSVFLYMLNVVNKTAGAGEECWDVLADKWETASRLGRLWTDESSAWVDHFTAQSQQQRPVWQVEGWKRRGWSSLSLCRTMVFFFTDDLSTVCIVQLKSTARANDVNFYMIHAHVYETVRAGAFND